MAAEEQCSAPPRWQSISLTHVEYPTGDLAGQILAYASLLPIAILVGFVTLIVFKRELHTISFFGGLVMNEGINWLLKHILQEPRPCGGGHSTVTTEYGMPSSHSQFIWFFVVYFFLFLYLRMHQTNNARCVELLWRHVLSIILLGVALSVSYSRVYLLYHTWSQVIYGGVAGTVVGVVWFFITQEVLTPIFPKIAAWPISEFFLVRDTSLIPNILWFEYTVTRSEASGSNDNFRRWYRDVTDRLRDGEWAGKHKCATMETCRWCTASPENDVAIVEVLQRYCSLEMTPKEMHDANSDFIYCLECVVRYHQARERVPALHKRLWELETARLLEVFREMLEADLEDDDLFFVDNGHEQRIPRFTPEEFHNRLRFPLVEVLKYPYLLCHKELCEMVVNVLCKMEDMKNPLPVHDQYQGTYLLMVHPNEMVRRWAIATARSLGRVDRDNYYDLQEVFSCMFYIIDLGITVDDFLSMSDSYCSGKLQILPPHLYDSKNKKSYWLGICMLLMQLDSQAMDSLLMGPEGQNSIPQCIINTMTDCNKDDDLDPYWPALHCFLVILDRLGSKIWGQIEPLEAFQAITKAGSYMAKIDDIRQKTEGTRVKAEAENHDDLLSCSQIVYDCYTTERASRSSDCSSGNSDTSGNAIFEEMSCLVNVLQSEMGQDMRVYGSTFLWFIPFVRSLMEVTVLNSICIGEVIHYLDNNVNKDVLFGRTQKCDKVTEFFIRILVDIIELHLRKSCMERLSYFSHIWVDMVIQCATLSNEICYSRSQDRRGFYSTPHLGRGLQMPSMVFGAISQACIKLTRSLLKEGGRTGMVPESAYFLDLINRHLRGFSSKGWNLSKSEYENLKKCLLRLVKVTAERPSVSNDVLPCAPPTPPSDPLENVILHPNSTLTPPLQQIETKDAGAGPEVTTNFKNEPVWDPEEGSSFCDGREDIKTKKEPCNAIPISEYRPSLEGIRITSGRIQEIRSRLTNESLSRIEAFAKGVLKSENKQDQCIETGHSLSVSPQPSTSKSELPDTAKVSEYFKKEFDDDDDDDEPLNVRRHRLKRSFMSCEEASPAAKLVLIKSSSAKEVQESNVVTISDNEVSLNDEQPSENRMSCDDYLALDHTTSQERDFDDLSESQVFEFETQAPIASAWNELHTYDADVTKMQKLVNDSKARFSNDSVEPIQTQRVSFKGVEDACLEMELQISKQRQPQEPILSSIQLPPKPTSSDLVHTRASESSTKKTGLSDRRGKQFPSKAPPVIEALNQKIRKRNRAHEFLPQDPVKQCSTIFPSKSSSASSVAPSRSTPAIVPPKKVRKRVEPECPAEFLGLKKKERKAFEFSQRSLDSLGALRTHGQNVHVDSHQKSKRPNQQKVGTKKGKKQLLASQDMQYFRQSRTMLQKSSVASTVAKSNQYPIPDALPKFKPANETVKEPEEEEEDDYSFLPCSQPDPDQRINNKIDTGQENTSLTNDSKETSDWDAFDDEWASLTQNEPTDMELCSQMEQDYGENLMLTGNVYMHNDPGNQPNMSEGAQSAKPVSSCTPQKSVPDASSLTSSNDNLFLKPSMPAGGQKKAKPSTTKIYTSSSRSASLAKEMEKIANPIPVANVAKAKVARPPQAMPPPPPPPPKSTPQQPSKPPQQLGKPLPPRPVQNSLNHASKSSNSNATSAYHVPSYKTYARPEAPVSVQPQTVDHSRRFDHCLMYDQSYLKQSILKWEYRMFENYQMFGTPQDLCPLPLTEVPTTFSSYKDYFNNLYPLLLINTFEEMVNEWIKGRKIRIDLKVQGIEYCNRIATASFTASLNADQETKQLYLKEDDLVLLWLPENTGVYANDEPESTELSAHFGCVLRSSVLSNERGHHSTLNLTIQTFGNVSSINTQPVCCELIGSLVTTLREFRALCLLQKSKMLFPVIKPDIHFYAHSQDSLSMLEMPDAKRPSVSRSAKSRTRILLCTPSNAAIDNLMKKIIIAFKEKCSDIRSPQGNCGDINLVRLGSERTISKELKPFSLDSQVKKGLEKEQHKADMGIHRKKVELDKMIDELSQQCAKTDKKSPMFEQLNAKKLSYLHDRKKLSGQLMAFRGKKQAVQSCILCDAHVICCTLSTSGSSLLESAFRGLGHEPFSCVIVDEAGQAKETETLIPLLYRCQNLILVGDHMQLPPTVVSKKAKELNYDQSLMARVWRSLNSLNTQLSPGVFLRVQYRMHPDICEFPSKYIYNNNLKNDPETAQKLCSSSWPFEPYRVFDVTDGKESRERNSFSNSQEVKLVVLLYKQLGEKHALRMEKQPIRVGIMTPYNAQKQRILQALEKETDKELKKHIHVEVDTVDGFQGREMDCIIVSCVRASSEGGSIGFVANLERMNVTITRAKYSLFILGHLRTLEDYSDWGALVRDAEKRGAKVTAREVSFPKVTKVVLKPVRFSRSYSHPSSHPPSTASSDRTRDHRMHARPTDPRPQASREQQGGNQSYTRPGPLGRRTSDSQHDRRSTSVHHKSHFSSSSHRTHK
ncbi:putative helicase senataxin [Bagarius yarrelli]|uniref:Dolichyldiphosphatase 1 n=1 Tax=Bagarius yarrelli TaxID=175774 RepID=A0A556TUB2_BAGYA|nr:putative helicase senataxin [Bagarius yarrelli]